MERIVALAIGYAFGLFQTAYFYGKAKGVDIRQHGSGNAGTTNALRVLGTKAGLIVFAGDCLKCILAICLVKFLYGASHPQEVYLLSLYAAMGAILGHNFPFYMNFRGGKGIAATAGLILSFHPSFIPVGVILFFGAFLLTHYVSLGSLLVYAGFLLQLIISLKTGLLGDQSGERGMEMLAIGVFLTAMAYWKHRENIVRLVQGKERKTYLFGKKEGEGK